MTLPNYVPAIVPVNELAVLLDQWTLYSSEQLVKIRSQIDDVDNESWRLPFVWIKLETLAGLLFPQPEQPEQQEEVTANGSNHD